MAAELYSIVLVGNTDVGDRICLWWEDIVAHSIESARDSHTVEHAAKQAELFGLKAKVFLASEFNRWHYKECKGREGEMTTHDRWYQRRINRESS